MADKPILVQTQTEKEQKKNDEASFIVISVIVIIGLCAAIGWKLFDHSDIGILVGGGIGAALCLFQKTLRKGLFAIGLFLVLLVVAILFFGWLMH